MCYMMDHNSCAARYILVSLLMLMLALNASALALHDTVHICKEHMLVSTLYLAAPFQHDVPIVMTLMALRL